MAVSTTNIIPFPPERLAKFNVCFGRYGEALDFYRKVTDALKKEQFEDHI